MWPRVPLVIHDLLICDRLCARVTYFGVYVITPRLAYICAIAYCFSLAVCVRLVICTQVTTLVAMCCFMCNNVTGLVPL